MFKAALLSTPLGNVAQSLRDRLSLHRAVERSLESVGTAANDSLARHLLERLCLPGKVFIDVGAHIGSVIDGVRRHSRPAHIIAVEAIPSKAAALRKHFPGITLHCVAAGEVQGETTFFIDERRAGYSSLDPTLGERTSVKEIVVTIDRLDALTAPNDVDLIKIDVEGAELGVLRGSEAIIKASRPTIMFESGALEMAGFSKPDLWTWLTDRDYQIIVPNRLAHEDDGLNLSGFLEAHLYPRRTTNYFAVARERRIELRDRARILLGVGA